MMVDRAEADRIERLAEAVADSDEAPSCLAPYLRKAAPVIGVVGATVEVVGPHIINMGVGAYGFYSRLPKNHADALWGGAMCFYGGRYSAVFAAIEAFKVSGGNRTVRCCQDVIDEMIKVKDASTHDDKLDDDNDGVPDVEQIDKKSLFKRKMALFMRTIDPTKLGDAIAGIWSGYMGVLAALKFKFARTVALGNSISDKVRPAIGKILAPALVSVVPPEYHQWINPSLNVTSKLAAGIIAWKIQQAISTVESGLNGGLIVTRALFAILRDKNWITMKDDDTVLDELGGYALAACGIYYQMLYGGFPLPAIVKPCFWPLDFVEFFLEQSVSWMNPEEASPSKRH